MLVQRGQKMIEFYEDRRLQVAAGQISKAEATRNDTPNWLSGMVILGIVSDVIRYLSFSQLSAHRNVSPLR